MKNDIKKDYVVCNTCGSDKPTNLFRVREYEYEDTTEDEFGIVRCGICGLVYLNPRPAVSEMGTIYPDNYYAYELLKSHRKSKDKKESSNLIYRFRKYMNSKRVLEPLSILGDKRELNVLDIGCGDGICLNWFRDLEGYRIHTYGVEMHEEAARIAEKEGHRIYKGLFEETDLPVEFFDCIISSHVIEHVADPKSFLRKVHSVLKQDGVFSFETPNTDCMDLKIQGKYWGGFHVPRHWNLYDESAIRRVLVDTGFNTVKVKYIQSHGFWIWGFHNLLRDRFGVKEKTASAIFPVNFFENNLKNTFIMAVFWGVDMFFKVIYKGKTSIMRVICRKEVVRE